jgi:TolB-like protein/Flp pilus assembly protein TadD
MEATSIALIHTALENALASSAFAKSERTSKFLRFVVEEELAGRGDQLKEAVVGVGVFARAPSYDVRQDSVVRTEASKLRDRLELYYATEGAGHPIIIELPKGGYRPVFRSQEVYPVEAKPELPLPSVPGSTSRTKIYLISALASALVFASGAIAWRHFFANPEVSIAVLPLLNLSQDPANEYFSDGLTSEIIRNLSIIEGLSVRSQTSSFALKGKEKDARETGRQLGVDYLLEGSVLRSGQQLRIDAQLIRIRDDFPLWSGRYDRELKDIFAIQDEISRGIVNSLRLKLGQGRRRYEISSDLYDQYLRARALTIKQGLQGINNNTKLLEEVIAKDPTFAPAYADLAGAYAARSGEFRFDMDQEMTKMRTAADKAIQLDPLLSQAYRAQGMIDARLAQWDLSEKHFRRAIEIDPNNSDAHADFALFYYLPLGRFDEALRELSSAAKADPLSAEIHSRLAYVSLAAGQSDKAQQYCQLVPETYHSGDTTCLGRIPLSQGKTEAAIKILEARVQQGVTKGDQGWGDLGYAYAKAGRREDAEKLAATISPINPFNQAVIFAGLGDKDRTFEALDRATTAGPFRIGRALSWFELSLVHGDPREQALRKKVGLP